MSMPDGDGGRTSVSSSPWESWKAASLLIRHRADVDGKNERGQTNLQAMIYPPSWEERYGDPISGIEFLLSHGADINALSDDGKTALDIAIEKENDAIAALLREGGGLSAEELHQNA